MVKNFLGNCRAEYYEELVEKLSKILEDTGAKISVKVHVLYNPQDKFSDNCGNVINEQGEWFHQIIKTIKNHYQGWWDKWMMGDYCWSTKKDLNNIEHDRQTRKRKFSIIVLMFTKVLFLLLV